MATPNAVTTSDDPSIPYALMEFEYLQACYRLATQHVPHIVTALEAELARGRTPLQIRTSMAMAALKTGGGYDFGSKAVDGALEYLVRKLNAKKI